LRPRAQATPFAALSGVSGEFTAVDYRIIWRLLTLEDGDQAAEVVYVGIRSEGDEGDAYREVERVLGSLEGL
jgi:hypothetical protein